MPAFSLFLGLLMLAAFWIGGSPGDGLIALGIMAALGAVAGVTYIASVAILRARS
jgi:hypothetical protein